MINGMFSTGCRSITTFHPLVLTSQSHGFRTLQRDARHRTATRADLRRRGRHGGPAGQRTPWPWPLPVPGGDKRRQRRRPRAGGSELPPWRDDGQRQHGAARGRHPWARRAGLRDGARAGRHAQQVPRHASALRGQVRVAACLLSEMLRAGGRASAAVALPLLRATNCQGATALYEAVRNGHAGVVALLMAEAPELASVANDGGVSPLYLAATVGSMDIVRALLRPLPDRTPSPASAAGPDGRTALHSAATTSKGMITNTRAICE